jgi:hypothetical protein
MDNNTNSTTLQTLVHSPWAINNHKHTSMPQAQAQAQPNLHDGNMPQPTHNMQHDGNCTARQTPQPRAQ